MSKSELCPKCNKYGLSKDDRASSDKREIWTCLYNDCHHTVRVPLLDKDEQIKQLQAELKALKKDGLKGNIPLAVLDQIVRMQEELDKLRWIPVGEGLPKKNLPNGHSESVICLDWHYRAIGQDRYDHDKKKWRSGETNWTHWRVLALPPEPK